MIRRVYLDYNATAPVRPEVADAARPHLFAHPDDDRFGNASSVHWAGQSARQDLERARTTLATRLERRPSEIVFTSGGTEANNLALFGFMRRRDKARLLVSAVEHPAVLRPAERLAQAGRDVRFLQVDEAGVLRLDALEEALVGARGGLVSVMAVNNETGVVQPIPEIAQRVHAAGAYLHVDAVQAAGRRPLPLEADMLTLSAHKLGGLKGAGALAVRRDLPIDPLILGGAQERGHRAGTEAVHGPLSLAVALELAETSQADEVRRLTPLRDRLEARLTELPGVLVFGAEAQRVHQTTCALFDGVEREDLMMGLDLEGVAVSSGAACASGSLEASHVLLAAGVPAEAALAALRISMGWATVPADVDRLLEVLPAVLRRCRA